MAKSLGMQRDGFDTRGEAHELTIKWEGELADTGEIPGAELGAALQGWDRFLQLSFYSYQSSDLQVPKSGTSMRVGFRVRRVRKGSFVIDAIVVLGDYVAEGVVGGAAFVAAERFRNWSNLLIRTHIKAKRERKTLDGVVEELEKVAKTNEIRVSVDREDTEDFAAAVNTALDNATAPLDSSASRETLSLRGQTVEIVLDGESRQAIKAPFEPPALDPDAEDVIEAAVKFVRINTKTGSGLLSFERPADASQLSQQRFRCVDQAIRRRDDAYTLSMHKRAPLLVRMQRKNYAADRRGHYWLILGTAQMSDEGMLPYAKAERKSGTKKGKAKKGDE